MKQLFLASNISVTAKSIINDLSGDIRGQKLVYISTASEPDEGDKTWEKHDMEIFAGAGFDVTEYTLTGKTPEQVDTDLKDADVLVVAGGNPFYLLYHVQRTGFKDVAERHVNEGKIYIGSSSGSLVAGPDLSIAHRQEAIIKSPGLQSFEGMKLVDFVTFPHWGSDMSRELYMHHRLELAYNMRNKIILLTDKQYVHVKDDWYRVQEISDQ